MSGNSKEISDTGSTSGENTRSGIFDNENIWTGGVSRLSIYSPQSKVLVHYISTQAAGKFPAVFGGLLSSMPRSLPWYL